MSVLRYHVAVREAPEWYTVWRKSIDYGIVEYGGIGISLFSAEDISRRQTGFAVSSGGQSLVGTRQGDWRAEWLVIGVDTACGDPIFTTLDSPHPVFTAFIGEGSWEPRLVSPSIDTFAQCLAVFRRFSVDRATPDELEANPPSAKAQSCFLEETGSLNGGHEEARQFWAAQVDIDLDTFQG